MVWRSISTRDSQYVSQCGDCQYFRCFTSIGEDYAPRWRRFQKIQQSEMCTDMNMLSLSITINVCRQLSYVDRQAVNLEPIETEDIPVCQQLIASNTCQRLINRISNRDREFINLSLAERSYRQLWAFSESELFSDSDFEGFSSPAQ